MGALQLTLSSPRSVGTAVSHICSPTLELTRPGPHQRFTLGQVSYHHLTLSLCICKMVFRGVNEMMSKFLPSTQ